MIIIIIVIVIIIIIIIIIIIRSGALRVPLAQGDVAGQVLGCSNSSSSSSSSNNNNNSNSNNNNNSNNSNNNSSKSNSSKSNGWSRPGCRRGLPGGWPRRASEAYKRGRIENKRYNMFGFGGIKRPF